MLMRSLSRRAGFGPCGERRSPTPGPRHKGFLPRHGGAGSPGPAVPSVSGGSRCRCDGGRRRSRTDGGLRRGRDNGGRRRPWDIGGPRRQGREQAGRATRSNNYWSSSTYQPNPSNAWNVNFNNGNTNNNNKTNDNFVRAVRGGS